MRVVAVPKSDYHLTYELVAMKLDLDPTTRGAEPRSFREDC